MRYISGIISVLCIVLLIGFIGYSFIGTKGNVETIKQMAPKVITERNWKILRYEGWQYGSWNNHGGKVWYQVCEANDSSVQYRTYVTLELFKKTTPLYVNEIDFVVYSNEDLADKLRKKLS